jgi:hypothetical protein
MVLTEYKRQGDVSVVPLEPEPVPCAACGGVGEFIVRIVRPHHEGVTGGEVVGPGPK